MTRVRLVLAAPVLVLATALAGCTSDFLLREPGTPPSETPVPTAEPTDEPTAQPTGSPTASPTPTIPLPVFVAEGCQDLRLNAPGRYVIGDCTTVTIEGNGISLRAARIGELVIRGDRVRVSARSAVSLHLEGRAGSIEADRIVVVEVAGDDNVVAVNDRVRHAIVDGDDNTITAALGFDDVTDTGAGNYVGVPQE